VLSSRAADGHQMYSRGSVVGKSSTIDPEISPTLPQFSQVVKSAKFGVVSTSLNFEPPAFENAARYSNFETKLQRSDDRPRQVW